MVVLGALSLLGACSDDGEGGADQGVAADQAIVFPDGSPPSEGGGPVDTSPPDQTGVADVAVATQNSGAICSSSQPCPNAGEECIVFSAALGKGMCLDPCATQGESCPVPDPNHQVSTCATTGYTPGTWYCAWFCELGGKTYACPNQTDYTCVASSDGVAKFCRPK
jgi:hypothetical protein